MNRLVRLVLRHGTPLVALNVFLEQIGAPIPAVPTLLVAGALSRNHRMSSTAVLFVAVGASLLADYVWFILGRVYGYRVLKTLCRISLSPDSCVRDTEARFERWGLKSLLVAKFVPGFSTVAPPLAGVTSRGTVEFLIYDAGGALLWAGSAVAAGRLFHHAIERVLLSLENLGWWAVVIVVGILALVIVAKWSQRVRFLRRLRIARVDPNDLAAMLQRGDAPVVLDVRTSSARKRDPRRIPTAIVASPADLSSQLEQVPLDQEIVLYCT